MTRIAIAIAVAALLLAAAAIASPEEFGVAPAPEPTVPDEVLLTDGTVLTGRIVEMNDDVVVIVTESLGRMEIPCDRVVRTARAGDDAGVRMDPDRNTLMFCPTPETLPRGSHYFRDFELFFLNFGTAVNDDVNISVGTIFPVSADVALLSLGAKVRLLDRNEAPMGLAATGSWTLTEDVKFGHVGVVAGVGDARRSFNVAVNHAFDADGGTEMILLAGVDSQVSRSAKFFAEFMSSSAIIDSDDIDGFLNIGFRLFGDTHSFSLAGFRPLVDSGSFIAWPMVMYSRHF